MCGIVFLSTNKKLNKSKIDGLLKLMKNRGPDSQNHLEFKYNRRYFYFFHSRLSIIDLKNDSNQPFVKNNLLIIFNGEIYNYLELRKELETYGVKFKTNSDTEVLLEAYRFWGNNFTSKLVGMWSLVLYDILDKKIFISRDPANEKPLFFSYLKKDNFVYASEIKYIYHLDKKIKKKFNHRKICSDLVHGYRGWFINNQTFNQKIINVDSFFNYEYLNIDKKKYIFKKILVKKNYRKLIINQNYNTIKKKLRKLLIDSVDISLRSDVPLAYSLSGGIDSNLITSISKKILNNKISTYSIIDKDPRYNESDIITKVCRDNNYDSNYINISKFNHFDELRNLTKYYSYPVPTINFLIQSYLVKKVKKNDIKVLISGNGGDEVFTGYYHHYLIYFKNKIHQKYKDNIKFWKLNVLPNIRNKNFKDIKIEINRKKLRSDNSIYFNNKLIDTKKSNEINFGFSKLKNRMLNEYYYETVPVLTFAEDLNCMKESIENRNPLLNKNLLNFTLNLPEKYMVQKGFLKFLLRDTFRDIMPKDVVNNYKKTGFNFSFRTLFPSNDRRIINFLKKSSLLYDWISKDLIIKLYKKDYLLDEENKFMFSFLTAKIYLDEFNS